MSINLQSIGAAIRGALANIPPPAGHSRPSTKAIYGALQKNEIVRPALEKAFGGPIKCRYAGCDPVEKQGSKPLKVLGYLWDFSFSRFSIPQTIEQKGTVPVPNGQKYELLFVAESELGTPDEICRDLLKLLDARAKVRCLIYREPSKVDQLHARMMRVLRNHAHFDPAAEQWLFIGLSWKPGRLGAYAYTLAADNSALVKIP